MAMKALKRKLPQTVEQLAAKLSPGHRRIADDYLSGTTALQAYLNEHPDVARESAKRDGYRVTKETPKVAAYIEAVIERRTDQTVLAKEERREILAQAIRGERSGKRTEVSDGNGIILRIKEESLPLDRALELDAKLAGDFNEGGETTVLLNLNASDGLSLEAQAASVFDGWGEVAPASLEVGDMGSSHDVE